MWQGNFARVALELHSARSQHQIMHATRNLLRTRGLLLHPSWARAVTNLFIDNDRFDNPTDYVIDGFLVDTRWSQATPLMLGLIRKLAKTFTPTDDPHIHRDHFWRDKCWNEQFALRQGELHR
jgi:hypothetical protein